MKRELVERRLFRKYKLSKKILNTGCGWGQNIEKFPKAIHIDIDVKAIKKLKKQSPDKNIQIGDCVNLKFKDNSFDYYLALFNVFDEIAPIENRIKAFKEAYRVLRPGGILILSSNNLLNPSNFIKRIIRYKGNLRNYVKTRFNEINGTGYSLYYKGFKSQTIKQGKSVGFKLLEVYPKNPFCIFPYYVFQKPGVKNER